MSYKLPKNIKNAGQLFASFDRFGDQITGLEMLSATLQYATEHHLMRGEICILLDSLISKAGARAVSAMLHTNLCQELPEHLSSESMDAMMEVAARARATIKAAKEGRPLEPEWKDYGDADWIDHYGDAAWSKMASPNDLTLSVEEYQRAQQSFLDTLHNMEGHYCTIGGNTGVSLIHTDELQSGYNPDLNYNSQDTVCDSSGFCRLINLNESPGEEHEQRYSDEWAMDYVREYGKQDRPAETVYYEAGTISHANDRNEPDLFNDEGDIVAGDSPRRKRRSRES